jgi:hypothetical protein
MLTSYMQISQLNEYPQLLVSNTYEVKNSHPNELMRHVHGAC